ncbi:hypothetical protein BJX63DRAFT_180362 [Aspergillus granulosus]|uniref:Uncharacterized protein n=1 Tax=Aspergillus granulosus TaxID=176169 RepID=A0ABR4I313_9EURO
MPINVTATLYYISSPVLCLDCHYQDAWYRGYLSRRKLLFPLSTIALKNWFSPAISFGFTALFAYCFFREAKKKFLLQILGWRPGACYHYVFLISCILLYANTRINAILRSSLNFESCWLRVALSPGSGYVDNFAADNITDNLGNPASGTLLLLPIPAPPIRETTKHKTTTQWHSNHSSNQT